jgi:hypothetical protein
MGNHFDGVKLISAKNAANAALISAFFAVNRRGIRRIPRGRCFVWFCLPGADGSDSWREEYLFLILTEVTQSDDLRAS